MVTIAIIFEVSCQTLLVSPGVSFVNFTLNRQRTMIVALVTKDDFWMRKLYIDGE